MSIKRLPVKQPNVGHRLRKISTVILSVYALGVGQASAQQLAILDSGVNTQDGLTQDGLTQDGLTIVAGFDYFNNVDDTTDKSGALEGQESHGNITARLAAEAFSGQIVPFVITDASPDVDVVQVRTARDSALSDILGRDDVRVVGIARNTLGVTDSSASLISDLSGANKVIAITAGEGGGTQPNALSTSSFNLSGVVIVGATDATGELLAGSNRAGTTQNKYVAVNGLSGNGAGAVGDTSFAAARLSGIAGAVLLQNPNLTAEQVVDVILVSAEDRGDAGTDSVFGRGVILNAEQVLNNVIGPVVVPTPTPITTSPPEPSSSGGGGGGGAILLVGGALAGVLLLNRKSSDKLEKTLVLDSYGRSFEADLRDQVEINDGRLHLSQFFHALQQQSANTANAAGRFVLPSLKSTVAFQASTLIDPRIDMIEYFATPGDVGTEAKNTAVSLAINSQLSSRFDFSAGYNVSPNQEFGGVSELDYSAYFGRTSFLSGQSFSSVLSGFSQQANTASLSYQTSSKSSVKLGLVSSDQIERFNQTSLSALFEGRYEFADNAALNVQFGQIKEEGSVLGGGGGGTFGVDNSVTYALNISTNIKASEAFSVVANYGIGRTRVESSNRSLLSDFSTLNSDWYSIGLIGNNIWRDRDQVGLAFSQPLKVQSGSVDYAIPEGRLASGSIGFDRERINLSDTNATEQTVEAYYRTMLSPKLELGGFVAYRNNPNHIRDRGDDGVIMATLRYWQ